MQKQSFLFLLFLYSVAYQSLGQVIPSPAAPQSKAIWLQNATLHLGDGRVQEGDLLMEKGKISQIGTIKNIPTDAEKINLSGKHVYPGFIAVNSDLGLEEIESVRATRDANETGIENPNARALIAYNTDSKVTPTVRCNGILMAQIAPKGGRFSGTSSIVQLDAWNYEDAVLVEDDAVYMNWYNMTPSPEASPKELEDWTKQNEKTVANLHQTMQDAIAYQKAKQHDKTTPHNLILESLIPILNQQKKLFIRAESEKQILAAIAFAQQYQIKIVIVGGQDSYLQTALLKKYDIPVVLFKPHQLPRLEDDAVDLPYRLPAILEEAGIPYCYDMDIFWNERNLPFQAGTSVAYGLTKEQALKSLAYYPAKILGIEKQVGSLAVSKDATLIVSDGDVLDMRTSNISAAYIQGRKIDLNNMHLDLYKKFKQKYVR